MRVAKKYVKLKNCILTFEGMPWERMFIKGLKKVNPKINVIGYQHAVVLQSALSAFFGERELNLSPKPDILLTSGIKTQKILNEYGNYPKTHIKVSSSLRYNYLNNIRSHLKLPNIKSMQILVALDGLVETADLLKYSIEQANLNINVNFIVRNHPAISINTMIKIAGYKNNLPINFRISENKSVVDDIIESDVILYWGTTISIEAVYIGRPVIHYDRGDYLSYDPLFSLKYFKWYVNKYDNIKNVINKISTLSEEEYCLQSKKARAYARSYFHRITNESLSLFRV